MDKKLQTLLSAFSKLHEDKKKQKVIGMLDIIWDKMSFWYWIKKYLSENKPTENILDTTYEVLLKIWLRVQKIKKETQDKKIKEMENLFASEQKKDQLQAESLFTYL